MRNSQPTPSFKASLGTFDLTMIVISAVIGSGIFLSPAIIVRSLGDPTLALGMWVLGGLMALAGALTFAELANVLPRVGGLYAYLGTAYAPAAGFTYGWCMLLVVNSGSLAALCVACAEYLSAIMPMSPVMQKAAAVGMIMFLTAANYFGVRQGSVITNAFTLIKIAGIAALVLCGFFLPHPDAMAHAAPVPFPAMKTFAAAMVGVLWAYGGWQYSTFPAGETKQPSRTTPLSIIVGVGIIILLYLTVNYVYLSVLPVSAFGEGSHVASLTAERLLGPWGGTAISMLIVLSTFGTASVYTLAAPRIYYAMSRDGLFFPRMADLHPKYNTPSRALLAQCAVVTVYILSGSFDQLISYVSFVDWIFYAATAAAVLVFRKTLRDVPRAYKTLGYPVTPLFFIAISLLFVVYLFFNEPVKSGIGLCILATAFPAYLAWKHKGKKAPQRR